MISLQFDSTDLTVNPSCQLEINLKCDVIIISLQRKHYVFKIILVEITADYLKMFLTLLSAELVLDDLLYSSRYSFDVHTFLPYLISTLYSINVMHLCQ